jgi:hypothetical protein
LWMGYWPRMARRWHRECTIVTNAMRISYFEEMDVGRLYYG